MFRVSQTGTVEAAATANTAQASGDSSEGPTRIGLPNKSPAQTEEPTRMGLPNKSPAQTEEPTRAGLGAGVAIAGGPKAVPKVGPPKPALPPKPAVPVKPGARPVAPRPGAPNSVPEPATQSAEVATREWEGLDLPATPQHADLPAPAVGIQSSDTKASGTQSADVATNEWQGLELSTPPQSADLPAPSFGLPARKGPAMLEGLDLPAPVHNDLQVPDDGIELSFGDDLPMPAGGSHADLPQVSPGKAFANSDLDLPAPSFGGLDLPSSSGDLPGLKKSSEDLPGLPSIDLPVGRSPARPGAPPSIDLPGTRKQSDLQIDLPVAQSIALPAAAAQLPGLTGAQLPQVKTRDLDLDLPKPSLDGAQLPRPSLDLDLPKPGGLELDLPMPGAMPLPGSSNSLDLPTPGGPSGRSSFDSLDLPMPDAVKPVAKPSNDGPADFDLLELGDFAGGGVGSATNDNSDLLQLDASPGQGRDSREFVGGPEPVSAKKSLKKKTATPTTKKKSAAWKWAIAGFSLSVIGVGIGLSFTPLGPFGWYSIEQLMPAAGDINSIRRALQDADRLMYADDYLSAKSALRRLSHARNHAGVNRTLLGRSLIHECWFQIRFGSEPASESRAGAIRQRLEQRGTIGNVVGLGIGADALRQGNTDAALAQFQAVEPVMARDPMFHLMVGEAHLLANHLDQADSEFHRAEELGGGAAALWGRARVTLRRDRDNAWPAVEAVLASNQRHTGARVELAIRAFENHQLDDAQRLSEEVTGVVLVAGERLRATRSEESSAWTTQGRVFESRHRPQLAFERYERAVQVQESNAQAILGAGRSLLSDRPTEALSRFETVISMGAAADGAHGGHSLNVEARLGAVQAKLALNRAEDAVREITALSTEFPEDGVITYWRGVAEQSVEHLDAAEQNYRDAIRQAPTLYEAHLALATLYHRQSRVDDAAAVMEQVRASVPESAALRSAIGQYELRRGQLPLAEVEFRRALELEADYPPALFGLGVSLRRQNQFPQALELLTRLGTLIPNYPGLALERGIVFETQGRPEQALEFYREALVQRPNDTDLMLRLVSALIETNAIDDARTQLDRVEQLVTQSADAVFYSGRISFARGQIAEAVAFFERAIEINPQQPQYFGYAAWAAMLTGNLGQARTLAQSGLQLDASLGDGYWIRGEVALRSGLVRDAARDLERAAELSPRRAEIFEALGRCYDQTNRLDDAIRVTNRALELQPDRPDWLYRLARLQLDAHQNAATEASVSRATLLGETLAPAPYWLGDAHRIWGDMLRGRAQRDAAIEHYRRFLALAGDGDVNRRDVEEIMLEWGQELD